MQTAMLCTCSAYVTLLHDFTLARCSPQRLNTDWLQFYHYAKFDCCNKQIASKLRLLLVDMPKTCQLRLHNWELLSWVIYQCAMHKHTTAVYVEVSGPLSVLLLLWAFGRIGTGRGRGSAPGVFSSRLKIGQIWGMFKFVALKTQSLTYKGLKVALFSHYFSPISDSKFEDRHLLNMKIQNLNLCTGSPTTGIYLMAFPISVLSFLITKSDIQHCYHIPYIQKS